ncbi:monocarboxylate transporter 9 [Plutella xylostella]|uniref:monocarboxylate transporter 9 n=1 Tax=Plutella xylostella TaxID=51655 RepID=UPI0020326A8E|nr:monocarboxylate transporter 9 [Plutella xylostella]XP_048482634.1 monocarboxylate transporter 9 [Plutella xylostella]XP_048482635.1 monocarboxylate transporter 9 [Plutella xylostella]
MERALQPPPAQLALCGPLQGGPGQTDETAARAGGLSVPAPESQPLLRDKRPGALHVQFDAASPPPAPDCSSSSSSSSDDEDVCLAEARPPDGGWGWVVVFASFMVNLIADGITFSFGVFYPHFLEYFGEGKGKTAWIAGIFMAMPLLSGPIASFLTDRYGCRRMTIFGAILASIGFVVSAFVDNIETLFLTFGIMAGFGLSLCYVAAVVIVAYYFEKKRSLATGISVCGSGIGTFVFAPLSNALLDEYGWRGTVLILAGFFLNMAVCGLLFRDLPWTTTMNEEKAKERKRRRERKRLKRYAGSSADSFSDSVSAVGSTKQEAEAPPPPPPVPQFSSLVDLPTYMTAGDGISLEVFELMSNKGRAYAMLAQNYPGVMLPSRSFSDSGRLHEMSPPRASPAAASPPPAPAPHAEKTAFTLWLKKQATTAAENAVENSHTTVAKKPTAFFKDLRMHRHSLTYRGAMLNINRYRLRASSCPNIFRNSMTTIAKEKLQWYAGLWDFWDLVVDVLDFSHFLNPAFALFALSNFLLYMWYDVPYVYMADHALGMGFNEKQSSMLISIIGIVNMFGEILLGWVGDWECANPSMIYAFCMVLCGVVTGILPLLTSYWTLGSASGAFGAFIAANYSLTSIILVEQITLEKFTNAYGLLLLIQGLANLVGPPLGGWIYDVTGTYDLSFYLSGIFIALSGVILVVLPVYSQARRYNQMRKQKTETSENMNGTIQTVQANGKMPI